MLRLSFILSILYLSAGSTSGQTLLGSLHAPLFGIPDTVCVGQWVTADPGSIAGSEFNWSFCSADAQHPPDGTNLGNPSGVIDNPRNITLVRNGSDCFAFLTNQADSSILRIYFGNSYNNPSVSSDNLGNLSLLSDNLRGIQIIEENGTWRGFIVDGGTFYRFTFVGNSLFGQPQIIQDIPFPNVIASSGLIIRREGTGWVGFATDNQSNNLIRLSFPTQLVVPQITNLGNLGDLNGPAGLSMLRWKDQCYLFIANEGNSTITRVDFGSSFMGTPTGTNLGNTGGLLDHCTGIEVIGDCEKVIGYVTNRTFATNKLVQLRFDPGPGELPSAISLGNPGMINGSSGISELIRSGDTIVGLIPNAGDNTLTRLRFPACTAASLAGFQGLYPDPFYYLEPGTWNIHLSYLDPGALPQEVCKPITVIPALSVSLGPDRIICEGSQIILDAGSGYAGYTWSNGATGQAVTVADSGSYWVKVTNTYGCDAADTVTVTVMNTIELNVDTLLCFGRAYWAEGAWQTTRGIYYDTAQSGAGCDSVTITNLDFKAEIPVNIGNDTLICPGRQILLNATLAGAAYRWQDGSTDSVYLVTEPGRYRVEVSLDGCTATDSIIVYDCPAKLWFPTAFTPNGDGLNDVFRPVGISIRRFRMAVFDRWGQQLFETPSIEQGWDGTWQGQECLPGTYSFVAFFEKVESPGVTEKMRGSFTLVR